MCSLTMIRHAKVNGVQAVVLTAFGGPDGFTASFQVYDGLAMMSSQSFSDERPAIILFDAFIKLNK